VKMNLFILGFHLRVWCPKWTPLASSSFMLTTAMAGRSSRTPRRFSITASPGAASVLRGRRSAAAP